MIHRLTSHYCHCHRYSVTLGVLVQAWHAGQPPGQEPFLDSQFPQLPATRGLTFLSGRLQDQRVCLFNEV